MSQDFLRFQRRATRHLLVGTALAVVPAAAFYLAIMPFTAVQRMIVLGLAAIVMAIVLPIDLLVLRWTLRPLRVAAQPNATAAEVSRGYTRLLDLPWMVLWRVWGPHTLLGSALMSLLFWLVNPRAHFMLDWHDYVGFWALNLIVVPIGHAVYEFTAIERDSQPLAKLLAARLAAAEQDVPTAKPIPFTLRSRMGIFFTLLSFSPFLIVVLTVLKQSEGLADFAEHRQLLENMAIIAAAGAGLFIFVLNLFGAEIRQQTRRLIASLDRLAAGDLNTRVELHTTSEFGQIADHVNVMAERLGERQKLRDLFGAYMTTEVAEKLLAAGDADQSERRYVALMFIDVRGFTAFSRDRSPEVVVSVLNRLFDQAVEAIANARGTVNKYLGDGLLAVFGAPVELENPCAAAVEAALDIRKRLAGVNHLLIATGMPELKIGIGIHAGEVVVGPIGSAKYKLEYTVIGDAVNIASRIEQLTKTVGTELLVSEEVFSKLQPEQRALTSRPIDEQVKGVAGSVRVYPLGAQALTTGSSR